MDATWTPSSFSCRWCHARLDHDGHSHYRCRHCDEVHPEDGCALCRRVAATTDDRDPGAIRWSF